MTKPRFLTPSVLTIAFAAFSLVGALVAQAATVRVFVLAPNGTTSLNYVETTGVTPPAFEKHFTIPYDVVEPFIRDQIKSRVDQTKSGTEVCPTIFCPDVHWKVTIKLSDFSFTQKGQPVVTAFGNPQQNGVDVSVQAQMKIHLDITVWADTSITFEKTTHIPVDFLIGVNASARLNLWPEVKSQNISCPSAGGLRPVCVRLTRDGGNIDWTDVNGAIIATGAEIGTMIGVTPIGLGIGGPLGGFILGELGGNAAADLAQKEIEKKADKAMDDLLKKAQEQIMAEVGKRINAEIQQANKLKDKLLNTKLPGVGKSYQELSAAFGLTLDVQTTTPSGNVNVIVTPRLAAAAGSGKLAGKLRFPKEQCMYLKSSNRLVGGTLPMGLNPTNQDMAAKVGSPCSSIFPLSGVKVSGYLGASPNVVQGAGANSLPTWKSIGSVSFTGNLTEGFPASLSPVGSRRVSRSLTQSSGYYECGFEISGLPNADIVELDFSEPVAIRLTEYDSKLRYLEVSALGQKIVLDSSWKKVAAGPQSLVIGGVGHCSSGSLGHGGGLMTNWLERLKDKFDPEKCPQCEIRLNGRILEITNPDPIVKNPALKSAFESLELERAAVRRNIGGQQKLPQDLTVQPKLAPR